MAKFQTDFSEFTAGVKPTGWTTSRGSEVNTTLSDEKWVVASDASATGGQLLQFRPGGTINVENQILYPDVPSSEHQRAQFRWRASGQNGSDLRLFARAVNAAANNATGYTLGVRSADLDINKYSTGSFTNFSNDSGSYTAQDGTWYLTECEVVGINPTTLRVKTWPESGTKPSSWDVTGTGPTGAVNDTDSPDIESGGFGLFSLVNDAVDVDWLVVTTAGEDPAFSTSTAPSITNVDGDNAVTQYQQPVTIALSDFIETIASVTINGVSCTIDSQVVGTSVDVVIPGTLTTSTYDVVVSGATETATLTGVSYTQTHARPAFDGLVDSNSILSGQSYTADSYFRFVTSFSNGTLDTAAGDAAEWAGDIADYYTPDGGFTGDDTASIEFLYSDGTTSATVGVTVTVEEEVVQAPQGTITIGTITKDDSSASIPFTYSDTDQDSFEYSMNGGTSWDTVTSPISLTGLNDGELYSGLVRPVNSAGTGTSAGFSFTTDSLPDSWPFSKGIRYAASKTWSWGNRHPVTGMRVRMYK